VLILLAPTYTNALSKPMVAQVVIDMLNSVAPAAGVYATLLSGAIQFIHGEQAIAELKKMYEDLGRSADATWRKFNFGDEFPQHVYEFVLNESKHSSQRNPPKEVGAITQCFFVFNGGNQRRPKLARLCEENPLPDGCFGSFTDLVY
jgi:hypothetical protein